MSHKDAPPETLEQVRMREFYRARGVSVGWGRAKDGTYLAPFARVAWAAWQAALSPIEDKSGGDCPERLTDQPEAALRVTDEMVNRFLAWRLPDDFGPDGGIQFTPVDPRHWPFGTNLLTAIQARAMLEHVTADQQRDAPHGN